MDDPVLVKKVIDSGSKQRRLEFDGSECQWVHGGKGASGNRTVFKSENELGVGNVIREKKGG